MKEYLTEALTISIAAIAGLWTVIRYSAARYDELERRTDKLERDSVTHEELRQAIRDIEVKMDSNYHHMDAKIDSIKSDIMWIMQAVGKDK